MSHLYSQSFRPLSASRKPNHVSDHPLAAVWTARAETLTRSLAVDVATQTMFPGEVTGPGGVC